jgi:hypothetical protein
VRELRFGVFCNLVRCWWVRIWDEDGIGVLFGVGGWMMRVLIGCAEELLAVGHIYPIGH